MKHYHDQRCGSSAEGKSDSNSGVTVPLAVLGTDKPDSVTAGRVRASRMGRRRAVVLILVQILMLAHITHWLIAGRSVSPVEPSEGMATVRDGVINAGAVFFALALLSTLVLGRWFCGWGCHIVALQDLCGGIMKRMGLRPQPFRSRLLMFAPLAAGLYMFVWPAVYRVLWPEQAGAFPGFSVEPMTDDMWRSFPGVLVAVPFLLVCGFGTVYFLGAKGYCTYACPYGGFFGLLDGASPGRIRVNDACDGCGHCTAICTSNVRVHAEVRDYGMVTDPGCMKCMDCVSVCPQEALSFGLGRPAWGARRKSPAGASGGARKGAGPRSLSWGEELTGAAAFLAVLLSLRGAYGIIPFLFALGLAAIGAFGAVTVYRLVRRADVVFLGRRLRAAGRLQRSGWLFAAAAGAAFLLTAHTGFVRYHAFCGKRCYERTGVAEAAALAGVTREEALSGEVRDAVSAGRRHLETAARWGAFRDPSVEMELAWFSLLEADYDGARAHLERASSSGGGDVRLAYYRGRVALLQGNVGEAVGFLRAAIEEAEDNERAVQAQFHLGRALALTGRWADAADAWRRVLAKTPNAVAARANLAGSLREQGDLAGAAEEYARCVEEAPRDAELHRQLAITLARLGESERAREHFQRAASLRAESAGR